MTPSTRKRLGAILLDWPAYEWNLRGRSPASRHWTRIGNRRDRIEVGPGGRGARPGGRWTSGIHACDVFPRLGARLMARALSEWPVALADQPPEGRAGAAPDVSFVIGHRGLDRLPHLSHVLASVAAQAGVALECIVVEQSAEPEIAGRLPGWVRYVHTPAPYAMPYSRAWAFNVGARMARGTLLVLHDNDMLVPRSYATEALAVRDSGFEVMNLKRFVFYLGERETAHVLAGNAVGGRPARVIQNLEGGGSVVIDREAYFEVGGFDEAFVGWGGEDNEFWERCAVRAVWAWGYLPVIHLHHEEQTGKGRRDRATAALLDARSRLPAEERVRELSSRAFGRVEGPDPAYAPAEGSSS
ncbi:MAG TPA: galactosyltransferase-related protein [Gemmatimonadota bacterium]|nr:galactosyltransferase-related protein [Gemmatimonadota bacterium]